MNKILRKIIGGDWSSLLIGFAVILLILSTMRDLRLEFFIIVVVGELIYGYNLYVMKSAWSIKIKSTKLVDSGFFKYVRHPMYLGLMIAYYGLCLTFMSWIGLIATTVIILPFFYYRAKLEEELLIKKMKGYKEYMKKTGMFLPKFGK
ncbi:MAG: isoprenylcysteine carboxylmethyltransferase family protein [Nanoarchaeota archaeon]|nr:isoprenylcysteine carboxylmethyltransferase family protein [Nanoarchaeota archaeon]